MGKFVTASRNQVKDQQGHIGHHDDELTVLYNKSKFRSSSGKNEGRENGEREG